MEHELSIDGQSQIQGLIHKFILTKLLPGEDPINLIETTPLVSGGVIDSLNTLQVGLFLEKAFSIKISPEELANPENLETITAITSLVISKIQRR